MLLSLYFIIFVFPCIKQIIFLRKRFSIETIIETYYQGTDFLRSLKIFYSNANFEDDWPNMYNAHVLKDSRMISSERIPLDLTRLRP